MDETTRGVFEKTKRMSRTLIKSLFYLLIFCYPMLNIRIFQVFVCEQISDTWYLRTDFSIECYTAKWAGYACWSLSLVMVYTAGFPYALTRFLRQNKAKVLANYSDLRSPFYEEAGFLWNDYRKECYLWEVVELLRKLVLSSSLLLFDQSNPWQPAGACFFSAVCHYYYTAMKPMAHPHAGKLQHFSYGLTTMNYFVGLMLKVDVMRNSPLNGAIMVVLNLVMICGFCVALLYVQTKTELSVERDETKAEMKKGEFVRASEADVADVAAHGRVRGWTGVGPPEEGGEIEMTSGFASNPMHPGAGKNEPLAPPPPANPMQHKPSNLDDAI